MVNYREEHKSWNGRILRADDPFWTANAEPWTQVKAWGGDKFPKDHMWTDTPQPKDKW